MSKPKPKPPKQGPDMAGMRAFLKTDPRSTVRCKTCQCVEWGVIVNEFGEIGIDNDLIIGADEEVFEMNNGCVCCTVRGDLVRILEGLMKRKGRFDAIIVETTGLADPAPVAQPRERAVPSALTAVIGSPAVHAAGFSFAFLPVALNSVSLVVVGLLFHRFSRHD